MDLRKVLPAGVVLDGKYRIERVIGAGGFGITYAAHDLGLNTTIALKEYYPSELSVRDSTMSVRARSIGDRDLFERLRISFVQEARTLAQFKHPSIVRVLSVFEAHGTAYMVMEFEDGKSLKSWMRGLNRKPTQDELDRLFQPLLDALEVLHEANFLHRDIAPDNIILRGDGSPVLLDFGAARRVVPERSHQMTGLIKQGYSPQEQYTTDGKAQGPWTDIYALGATLYHIVTGKAPPESTVRYIEDSMVPAVEEASGDYRHSFLAGIDAAMAVRPQQRPQSVAELRELLFGDVEPVVRTSRPRTSPRQTAPRPDEAHEPQFFVPQAPPPAASSGGSLLRISVLASLLGAGVFGVYHYNGNRFPVIISTAQTDRPTATVAQPSSLPAGQPVRADTAAADEARERQIREAANRRIEELERSERERVERAERAERERAEKAERARLETIERERQEQARRAADLRQGEERTRLADEAFREGLRYANGTGVAIDHVRARALFEAAASAGRAEAMAWLGRIHQNGLGTAVNASLARDWFERAANAGDVASMAQLGQIYQNGQGTQQDLAKARDWFDRAANAGHTQSQHYLGLMFYQGQGVTQDHARARELFEKAALNGNVQSMLNLAHIYKTGVGLPAADLPKAREWFERAAGAGHSSAMNQLGVIYNDGLGVPKDPAAARSWFERSTAGGNSFGMVNLARLLNSGQGGAADAPRAAQLLLAATQQGGVDQATQEFAGNMAKWSSATRTEIKRELKRHGHYTGVVNDVWDDAAKKAVAAYRGRSR